MLNNHYYVYILSNKRRTVFYTGVTNNLTRRLWEHKTKFYKNSFTARYNCDQLVFYEGGPDIYGALDREKEIKGWRREKKKKLIFSFNQEFRDLSGDILE